MSGGMIKASPSSIGACLEISQYKILLRNDFIMNSEADKCLPQAELHQPSALTIPSPNFREPVHVIKLLLIDAIYESV